MLYSAGSCVQLLLPDDALQYLLFGTSTHWKLSLSTVEHPCLEQLAAPLHVATSSAHKPTQNKSTDGGLEADGMKSQAWFHKVVRTVYPHHIPNYNKEN
jgi:hypothetical protein